MADSESGGVGGRLILMGRGVKVVVINWVKRKVAVECNYGGVRVMGEVRAGCRESLLQTGHMGGGCLKGG
jgi:hypothetical protein